MIFFSNDRIITFGATGFSCDIYENIYKVEMHKNSKQNCHFFFALSSRLTSGNGEPLYPYDVISGTGQWNSLLEYNENEIIKNIAHNIYNLNNACILSDV